MKKLFMLCLLSLLYGKAQAVNTPVPVALMTSLSISSVTVANATATVTITTPTASGAFSIGYTNYVNHIHIEMYATGTLTGGATPVTCTTTNLSGNPVFKFQTAQATGTMQVQDMDYSSPLTSTSAATNTVVTCPATANVIWNVTVSYMQAP